MNLSDIKKYLEGKTSESESEMILSWLENMENDVELREILGQIWANSDINLASAKPDFNHILNQIHHRINSQKASLQIPNANKGNRVYSFYTVFSKIAAILILPLLVLSVYFYFNPKQKRTELASIATVSTREIYTKPGTRTKIDLPDGTNVWLNDGTTLRYPEKFTGSKREVFVDGEAYFEVKSDPKNPFVVNNPMMNTVVTGTRFNLNAYSMDNYFEATLLTGKINLEKNNQSNSMKPGEQVQFDALHEKMVRKDINPENVAAWINGRLIFKDEKVGIAIKKLGRWYNVEIILTDPELDGYLLTGTIQDEKLDQTLKLISLALPVKFDFKKENDHTKIQRIIYMRKK